MTLTPLPMSFYRRPTLRVARELLGKVLVRKQRGVVTAGRIVEVEAYLGLQDPASHAFRGITPRNAAMFLAGGVSYVYFTYGNHFCLNVVTGCQGRAGAVLIRALEPTQGISVMRRRRGRRKLTDLATGPGKLSQAMAIGLAQNRLPLDGDELWIAHGVSPARGDVAATPRIGITSACERLYRFVLKESPFLSKKTAAMPPSRRPRPRRRLSRSIRPASF